MRTSLTLCTVHRRFNPIAQCTINVLGNAPGLARPFMFTMSPRVPPSMLNHLRYMGGGMMQVLDEKVGKSFSYQLCGPAVYFEVSVMKSYAGKLPIRRSIYLVSDPQRAKGRITLKVGQGEIDIASGPLRILTSAEARETFSNYFKEPLLYRDKDSKALGLTVTGDQVKDAIREIETIDEHGSKTVIAVRRRRRIVIV